MRAGRSLRPPARSSAQSLGSTIIHVSGLTGSGGSLTFPSAFRASRRAWTRSFGWPTADARIEVVLAGPLPLRSQSDVQCDVPERAML
jgi:hypothetical protein